MPCHWATPRLSKVLWFTPPQSYDAIFSINFSIIFSYYHIPSSVLISAELGLVVSAVLPLLK